MSKSIKRSLSDRDQARMALRSLYSTAKHFGLRHNEMLDRRKAIYDRFNVQSPGWVRGHLEGYWQCLMDNAYESDLVFGGIVNGVFYSTHHDRADYYEKHGISPRDFGQEGGAKDTGHYWSATLKPFFTPLGEFANAN